MAEDLKLHAHVRTDTGSGPVGRLRRDGFLPAVIYGGGDQVQNVQLVEHDLTQLLRHHASSNVLVDLEVEGSPARQVMLKDLQHHPLTGRILHADFHSVSLTDRLNVHVSIELTGESVGVIQQGGVVEQLIREVEVECLPTDIPNLIEVDVTELMIGDTLTVGDLAVDATKLKMMTATDVAVVSVAAPRVEEAPAEEEEALAEEGGAEPEIIGEKKEAEEEPAEG